MKIPKCFRSVHAAEVSSAATLARLADAIGSGQGGMFEMTVYHDDDCPKLSGGECECEPEYSAGQPHKRGSN